MTLKNILLLSLLTLPCSGFAQFGLGKKKTGSATILNTPTIGEYVLHDPEYRSTIKLMDGYPDEKSAWIVYSDRDNNTTYQNPGNEKQPLASLNFMQAYFVIGEKDDYVELAEYVPRLNVSKGKKTLEDPKYMGWVNKNTLLLWNRSLKDKVTNYYLKTITAFGTQRIFDVLQNHVAGDSIIMFANPFLNQPVRKCGMESIFYIYKESVLGNEYLIGPDPNFLPENASQAGMGWVSKDLIRVWGTKGFIFLNPAIEASLPFFKAPPFIQDNQVMAQDPLMVVRSPYTTPKSNLEKLYPIVKYSTKDGKVMIGSSFLADILDKDKNRIYNISGDLISNEDIEKFSSKSSKLNIVLVVSAGRKNGQYLNNLQGVLETAAWQNTARNNFNEINIGAVVYKDYGPNCDNAITPLSSDVRAVGEFLLEQRKAENDDCDDNNYYQGMYGGIIKAAKMLHDHSNESNLILVYGSGSDETPRKGEAIKNIQNVNARMLFFQTHNVPNEAAYTSFVGDAQELITKSAVNITELKKKIIVPGTYANIINGVSFTNDSTMRVQKLDYPRKAITQGYLIFPHDGENMPIKYLADCLDSLINSIALDNRTIDNALHSAIAQSGSANTRIKDAFAYRFPKYSKEKIPLDFLKSNTLRNQNFLIPAWLVLGNDSRNQAGLTGGVLLSEKEYIDFANQMALLGSSREESKAGIVKQITNAVEKTQSTQNIRLEKPVKELTFSEALGFVTGYFPVDPIWRSTTLSEYESMDKVNAAVGKGFLEECKNKAVWLHDHSNNSNLQIRNNDRIYYLIDETHLPINTFIGQSPVERNIATYTTTTISDKEKEQNTVPDRMQSIGTVISDYNNNPAGAAASKSNTAQKEVEDIAKAKPNIKKDKTAGSTPAPQEQPSTAKPTPKKESGNISSINDDLNAAPPTAGANTIKKDNNSNNNDTVNYRKRLAEQQAQKERKKEQPKKNNADVENDLKELQGESGQNKTIPKNNENNSDTINYRKRIAEQQVQKEKKKEQPKRNNADFDNDLKELQGGRPVQNSNAAAETPKVTAPNINIKKEGNANINTVKDELNKVPAKEKENSTTTTTNTDTVNYRNRVTKQKTAEQKEKKQEEKKKEQPKTKNYNELDNDLKQLQSGNSNANDGKINPSDEKLTAPNVRRKAAGSSTTTKEPGKAKEDFSNLLNDLDNAAPATDKNKNASSAEQEKSSGKKKKSSDD